MNRLRTYRALVRINAASVAVYRADYLIGVLGLLLQILLLRVVWTAVYAQADGPVDGVPLATTLAFVTLANVQFWLLNPWDFSIVPRRIREGNVAADIARPVGFPAQIVAGQIGRTAALVPFAVLALPFAVLIGEARAPASPARALLFCVSLALGFLVNALLCSVMGLLAFWTMEVGGFFMLYRVVSQFFSGALVPLWFMPSWLRETTELLPFQAATYTPIAVYLGRSGPTALLAQAVWLALLGALLALVWRRALHRVVVQGG